MLKKLLVVLIAGLIILSGSAMALNSDRVKILENTSWVSGGDAQAQIIRGYIVDGWVKPRDSFDMYAGSTASSGSVRVYKTINSSGFHIYEMKNLSSQTKEYLINIKLCVESSCFHNRRRVLIPEGGSYRGNSNSYLEMAFSVTGYYRLEAETSISSGGDNKAYDIGNATIVVYR